MNYLLIIQQIVLGEDLIVVQECVQEMIMFQQKRHGASS